MTYDEAIESLLETCDSLKETLEMLLEQNEYLTKTLEMQNLVIFQESICPICGCTENDFANVGGRIKIKCSSCGFMSGDLNSWQKKCTSCARYNNDMACIACDEDDSAVRDGKLCSGFIEKQRKVLR